MKVVVDTYIIISAILKDRTPEWIILFVAERDDFEWLVLSDILADTRRLFIVQNLSYHQILLKNS